MRRDHRAFSSGPGSWSPYSGTCFSWRPYLFVAIKGEGLGVVTLTNCRGGMEVVTLTNYSAGRPEGLGVVTPP